MMRRLLELPLLVLLLGLAGLAMLLPAGHAIVMRDHGLSRSFLYMAVLVLVFAGMLGLARANSVPRNVARNHLISLAFAYVFLPPILALPLIQRAAGGADFGAATFDMLSAFTTTGAVVLEGPLKPTVQLWRAVVGWLGGLFALVMVFSVLAPLNLGGIEVETGRIPGRAGAAAQQIARVADPSERMARFAAGIFPIYGGLTLVLWILLSIAGEDSFVALCHAMAVLSTSGISPLVGGVASGQGGWIAEVVMAAFLLFALSRRPLLWLLGHRRGMDTVQDPELGLGLGILGIVAGLLFGLHLVNAMMLGHGGDFGSALAALWGLLFTLLSFLSTTGFVSTYWADLPDWSGLMPPAMVLWAMAIVGGGVACTAGGVKLLRVYALLRFGRDELDRLVHPNSVASRVVTGGSRASALQGTVMAWVFFMIFALSIVAFIAALTIFGMSFDESLVLTLSALTTTGPLVDQSDGIAAGFSALPGPAQVVLGIAMVVGRLETLAILAILLPENFRN